jgi:hypothetical protein
MGKKSRSGSGVRIRDEYFGSYFRELRNSFLGLKYKFFDADAGIFLTLDPGWKKLGSGIRKTANSTDMDPAPEGRGGAN